MYYPDIEKFKKEAKRGTIVPIYKEILADLETPVAAFLKLKKSEKYMYLLESVEGDSLIGRYSFLGIGANVVFKSTSDDVTIIKDNKTKKFKSKTPLKELKGLIEEFKPVLNENLPPFYGGAVGCIGYENVRSFEDLPYIKKDNDLNIPDMYFIFSPIVIIFDRTNNLIKIVSNVKIDGDPDKCYKSAIKDIDVILNKLTSLKAESKEFEKIEQNLTFKSNMTKKDYMNMVERGKEYIKAGDILQVVLSQRWELDLEINTFDIYRNLRTINPSPYMFYLKLDDIKLIGSSPEVMVKNSEDKVIVRPIAGTRRRGKTFEHDMANEQELLNDEKEVAEHIMLVDLGRNDLGRICNPGTVSVDELMTIERYSHVMHIVSEVSGISDKLDIYDIMKATFPAGTVSGAPKIRAMEIIEELEPTHRGMYSGAVSYFSYSGNFDTCIAIRTIVGVENKLYFQAGAGIVADSDPLNEYNETVSKIKVLFKGVARTFGINEFELKEEDDKIILLPKVTK